jgi:type IV pilus assembly protein PilN
MTRLNLLPWREMRRKELDKQVLRGSIFAWALMALAVFYVHYYYYGGLIDDQRQRNDYLTKEIATLDEQIQSIKNIKRRKEALIARMEVIQQLQRDRTQIVHVLDDLVRKLPEGMFLTSLSKKGKNISLVGVAQSNARISALMRNLDSSEWFANPNLDVINVTQSGGARVSKFTLRVTQADTSKQTASAKK